MNLFYKSVSLTSISLSKVTSTFFNDLKEGGRFYCNLSRALAPETYIPRIGAWSEPWPTEVIPSFEFPDFEKDFTMNFSDVTDKRAYDIKNIIDKTGKTIIVFYSGGIDSTVVMTALLKNLEQKYLDKIVLSMSGESIIENPYFYMKFLHNKFKTVDSSSNMYSDLLQDKNNICISADLGDFIYGTELGVKLYPQMRYLESQMSSKIKKEFTKLYFNISNPNTHYSEYKDLLIFYFNTALTQGVNRIRSISWLPENLANWRTDDDNFGELFYEKLNHNVKSVNMSVNSLHDLFWWSMFNTRYIWGAVRPAIFYGKDQNLKYAIEEGVFSWYGSNEYQQWSMHNNNNGEKINGTTQSSYKWASRKYLKSFYNNEFYVTNKTKMPSLPVVANKSYKSNLTELDTKWALDNQYNVVKINQPGVKSYFETGLMNYKIDWV